MAGQSQLPVHEQMVVVAILGLLITTIFLTSVFNDNFLPEDTRHPVHLKDNRLKITIEGAVENPGVYLVPKGRILREIVEEARPKATADLARYKLDVEVTRGRTLKIQEKKVRKKKDERRKSEG